MIGTLDWYDWLLIRRTTKYCIIFYDFTFLRTKSLHISYYFAFYGHTWVTMAQPFAARNYTFISCF